MYLDTPSMGASKADTKVITTVSTAEQLLHTVFDDGTRKPFTINQYCTRVQRLFKGMYAPKEDFDSLDWMRDTARIIEYLERNYSTKLSTQATYVNPLLVIARKLWPGEQ
jgi:hypothetical protein